MKQIIPDTKFNSDYFIIGKAFVITVESKQTHGLLQRFEDDRLVFTVMGCWDSFKPMEPKNMYVNKTSVESGETIIRQACAVADPDEAEEGSEPGGEGS